MFLRAVDSFWSRCDVRVGFSFSELIIGWRLRMILRFMRRFGCRMLYYVRLSRCMDRWFCEC